MRRREATGAEVQVALRALGAGAVRVSALDWPAGLTGLDRPGLYAWWVDNGGARMLSEGLGVDVAVGRIYAGQTGATKWPSGKTGRHTLRGRIDQHIGSPSSGGSVRGSTFRLTLAAALRAPLALHVTGPKKLESCSEQMLRDWILDRLSVAVHPFDDVDVLGNLERRVLVRLDPPLNLEAMSPTPLRARLTVKRREITSPV